MSQALLLVLLLCSLIYSVYAEIEYTAAIEDCVGKQKQGLVAL